jgi:hypothetical protein
MLYARFREIYVQSGITTLANDDLFRLGAARLSMFAVA